MFQRQENTVDYGVFMLINIHCLMHDLDEGYHDIKNLRYWIASKALLVTNDSRWYSVSWPSKEETQFIASMISSPEVKTEIKGLVKDIRCQLKQFKNVYNHVHGRRFVLDDRVR